MKWSISKAEWDVETEFLKNVHVEIQNVHFLGYVYFKQIARYFSSKMGLVKEQQLQKRKNCNLGHAIYWWTMYKSWETKEESLL